MTSPVDNTNALIGLAIKEYRLLSNKSLRDIGNKIGVSIQQMQKYEKGVNNLSSSYLFQIADFLNTPVEKFFPNNPESLKENQKSFEENSVSDSELTHLIKNYSQIKSKDVRKKVLELLKTLATS
ncbi:MAG: helix-turn-helix transcriptional regulator [Rickettsiales bacterium]